MISAEAERTAIYNEDVEINAAVMNIGADIFTYDDTDRRGSEYAAAINKLLGVIGPIVSENKGYFTNVSDTGITAVFENDCDSALVCAVTICQTALRESAETECLKGVTVGISYGSVCLSTARFERFAMPLSVSYNIHLSEALSRSAAKYNARILVSDSAVSHIPAINGRFNIRKLGMICRRDGSLAEYVYDVYDGDNVDIKYGKRRSKLFFESGVDLFLAGSFLQARTHFIELLKFNRDDRAAKQYIYTCDSCLSGEADELSKKYIEVW